MKNYFSITESLSKLRHDFDWAHSFVRELYFCSGHCFLEYQDGSSESRVGDAAGPLDLRLVVAAAGNPTVFGIEFICFNVTVFSLQRLNELRFDCQIEKGRVKLSLGNTSTNLEDCWVVSEEVQVAFLGKEYLGPSLRVGFEFPRDDAIGATKIDACWRQCTKCANAWVERPSVVYSRCPSCGELTALDIQKEQRDRRVDKNPA